MVSGWKLPAVAAATPDGTDIISAEAGEARAKMTRGRQTVISLDPASFEAECARLMETATRDRQPDVLVAIRSGGVFVAEAMAAAVGRQPHIIPITCRRPSSLIKRRAAWIMDLLGFLPRTVLNWLRVIEHRLLTGRSAWALDAPYEFDTKELGVLEGWLRTSGPAPFLLVVDDAVDTGGTLSHVLTAVADRVPPDAVIRSAVITVTTPKPAVTPDYTLYHGQLCRFPWSHDAR